MHSNNLCVSLHHRNKHLEIMADLHFRVDTPRLLKEIADAGLVQNAGVLFIPLNTLRDFLAQVANRCSDINDPILNRLMFDMNLYELPSPSTKEYGVIMASLYKREKEYIKTLNL